LPQTPGTQRSLVVHRFGTAGARPKVYLQAALHANEVPGIVVLDALMRRLVPLDTAGEVCGEVVVVPYANPIGLGDTVLGVPIGRYGLDSGSNFNRGFLDLGPLVAPRLEGHLAGEPVDVATIRTAFLEEIARRTPRTELEALRLTLLRLAIDADRVYDLHTEEDAMFAAVLPPWVVEQAAELVADVAPALVFYADYPPLFDTACSRPWHALRQHFAGRVPVSQGCLSATLEMRGVASIEAAQVERDADGLLRMLRRCGAVAGEAGPLPPLASAPIRFEGVEFVRAARAGIVVYHAELGERIAQGQIVAEVIDPTAADPRRSRSPVRSGTEGVLFCRRHTMLVRPDDVVAKVAGPAPLDDPKHY
jgi:uncharacterized protein